MLALGSSAVLIVGALNVACAHAGQAELATLRKCVDQSRDQHRICDVEYKACVEKAGKGECSKILRVLEGYVVED